MTIVLRWFLGRGKPESYTHVPLIMVGEYDNVLKMGTFFPYPSFPGLFGGSFCRCVNWSNWYNRLWRGREWVGGKGRGFLEFLQHKYTAKTTKQLKFYQYIFLWYSLNHPCRIGSEDPIHWWHAKLLLTSRTEFHGRIIGIITVPRNHNGWEEHRSWNGTAS